MENRGIDLETWWMGYLGCFSSNFFGWNEAQGGFFYPVGSQTHEPFDSEISLATNPKWGFPKMGVAPNSFRDGFSFINQLLGYFHFGKPPNYPKINQRSYPVGLRWRHYVHLRLLGAWGMVPFHRGQGRNAEAPKNQGRLEWKWYETNDAFHLHKRWLELQQWRFQA